MTGSEKGKWTPPSYEVQSAREDKANELYEALLEAEKHIRHNPYCARYETECSCGAAKAEATAKSLLSSLSGEAGK